MPSAPGSQKELLGPLWKITALILLEVSKYSALVFQLGPKPPFIFPGKQTALGFGEVGGGAGRGLPFNHRIGKAAAKLPFPFSSRSWKGGCKIWAFPLVPLPVPSPGWDRASQASARGARIWEAHGGCLLQPPKLQIRGEKAAPQPGFGWGASSARGHFGRLQPGPARAEDASKPGDVGLWFRAPHKSPARCRPRKMRRERIWAPAGTEPPVPGVFHSPPEVCWHGKGW